MRRCLTARATCVPTFGCCASPTTSWLDTEAIAGSAVQRHLEMYKIGRDVEIADATAERAIVSVIGPDAAELTGASPLTPEYAHREIAIEGARARAVATDVGIDLIIAATDAEPVRRALVEAGAVEVSEAAADPARRGGRPRFGAEMSELHHPGRGRDRRAGRQLHPRAATSARRRSRASTTRASQTATCRGFAWTPRRARGRRSDSATARWEDRDRVRLTRPRPDRAGDRPPRSGPGARVTVREGAPGPKSSSCRSPSVRPEVAPLRRWGGPIG